MKILMATGGSIHSKNALLLGAQLACRAQVVPTLLTVIPGPAARERGEQTLDQASRLLAQSGCPRPEIRLRMGHTEAEILAEVESDDYGLVVLGERRPHRLRTRLFGSVVMGVVAHASCPVLVVRGKIRPAGNVLICDSGAAQPTILENLSGRGLLAFLTHAPQVTVLHVISQITAQPGVEEGLLAADVAAQVLGHTPEGIRLAQDVETLEKMGIRAKGQVRHGLVVEEILAEVREGDYQLAVIGAHRRAGWEHFLLEDIARRVIAAIDRPILVVR